MIARARTARPLALVAGVLVLAACGSPQSGSLTAGEASRANSGVVDGVWRTDGYGWVIQVADGHARTYETTSLSCLPAQDLRVVDGPGESNAISFGKRDAADETIHRTGPDRATLRLLGTAAEIDMVALPQLPPMCTQPTRNDPQTTFDVFWASFAENYNSTVRKHVDWNALRATYRPRVTASTTPDQLYRILVDMVRPLGDAHIELTGDDHDFEGYRPGTRYHEGSGGIQDDDATKLVDEHLKQDLDVSDIRKWGDGSIAYTDLPDGRGYLRFTNFQSWDTKPNNYVGRQALLDEVLDDVFSDEHVRSWRGLVIDLGYNDGGDDALGLSIAGRMTDRAYTAYTKLARNDPKDPTKYGRARVVTVQPTPDKPHYTGPVRLITSDVTISAGETFAEAMMARTPPATRFGTTTQGVFADNMDRKLPNGWKFTVGNEDYLAPDGRNYEGPGIPPTTEVPMFTPDQLADHHYPALDNSGDTR